MYASDPCQERNLSGEVVQTLFEKIERCYRLIQALIHLKKKKKDKHIHLYAILYFIEYLV